MSDRPDWYPSSPVNSVLHHGSQTVRAAQLILQVPQTGTMDTATVSSLRGIQRLFNLPITGSLDLETARAIDSLRWTDAFQE